MVTSASPATIAAVVVTTVAALTGHRLHSWLEDRVDRVLSGGRIRGHAAVRQLAESLQDADPQRVVERTAQTVASALDTAWAVVKSAAATAAVGEPAGSAAWVSVPLLASDGPVGTPRVRSPAGRLVG